MNKTTVIRTLISLALLYGVYTETGPWTTICIFLVFLRMIQQGKVKEVKRERV